MIPFLPHYSLLKTFIIKSKIKLTPLRRVITDIELVYFYDGQLSARRINDREGVPFVKVFLREPYTYLRKGIECSKNTMNY